MKLAEAGTFQDVATAKEGYCAWTTDTNTRTRATAMLAGSRVRPPIRPMSRSWGMEVVVGLSFIMGRVQVLREKAMPAVTRRVEIRDHCVMGTTARMRVGRDIA